MFCVLCSPTTGWLSAKPTLTNSSEYCGKNSDCRPIEILEVTEFVEEHAEVVFPSAPATWPESDPDDRWIVASAIGGAVDLLVTGDKDLLQESHDHHFRIVTPRGFWELLRADDEPDFSIADQP